MATYLVTGGAGFIGARLVQLLIEAGHGVCVLDNLSGGKRARLPPDTDFIKGDIRDDAAVMDAMGRVDGCFHLAAIASVEACSVRWRDASSVNLGGTVTVLQCARDRPGGPIPVVYASSAAVYGGADAFPLAETAPLLPLSAYGADKAGGEAHARIAAALFGLRTTGLRFFNVYGPGQDPASPYSGVISIFADRLQRGLPVTILGDGEQTRDFIFVDDVCAAMVAAMTAERHGSGVYNVCTGEGVSISGLAWMIGDLLGRSPTLEFAPPRAGDVRRSVGDPGLIKEELGFEARISLREGLSRTLSALR